MHHVQLARQAIVARRVRGIVASGQSHICRTCFANAVRHASTDNSAQGWFKKLRNQVFGTDESRKVEKKRGEAQSKRAKGLAEAAELAKTESPGEALQLEQKIGNDGKTYEVARVYDPNINTEYHAADNWHGLERQGGEKWLRALNDGGEKYKGWLMPRQLLSENTWQNMLHHLAVEVFALQRHGYNPMLLSNLDRTATMLPEESVTERTTISVHDGQVHLTFPQPDDELKLAKSIANFGLRSKRQVDLREKLEQIRARQPRKMRSASLNGSDEPSTWMHVTIADPTARFAIWRAMISLTGVRPAEYHLSQATTLADLYDAFRTKLQPVSSGAIIKARGIDQRLPNLNVKMSKVSWVSKEKSIGRWKHIEQELVSRNLPLPGEQSKYIDMREGSQIHPRR